MHATKILITQTTAVVKSINIFFFFCQLNSLKPHIVIIGKIQVAVGHAVGCRKRLNLGNTHLLNGSKHA